MTVAWVHNFEEAHKIDRNYTMALINLAWVLSISNNVHGAIGKLNDIQSSDTALDSNTINMLKAITYQNEKDRKNRKRYGNRHANNGQAQTRI